MKSCGKNHSRNESREYRQAMEADHREINSLILADLRRSGMFGDNE
jgi:hypothetical protein